MIRHHAKLKQLDSSCKLYNGVIEIYTLIIEQSVIIIEHSSLYRYIILIRQSQRAEEPINYILYLIAMHAG